MWMACGRLILAVIIGTTIALSIYGGLLFYMKAIYAGHVPRWLHFVLLSGLMVLGLWLNKYLIYKAKK
jgi:hypothetical protein